MTSRRRERLRLDDVDGQAAERALRELPVSLNRDDGRLAIRILVTAA